MKSFSYQIKDAIGIHARPAGQLVKKAGEFQSSVVLKLGEKKADAKRIFGIMGLCVKCNDVVTLEIEGDDEAAAAEALEAFMKENL